MLVQFGKLHQKIPLTAKLDSVEFGSPQNFSHLINYFQLGQFVVFYFYLFIYLFFVIANHRGRFTSVRVNKPQALVLCINLTKMLRTVPPFVTAHTFCASRDIRFVCCLSGRLRELKNKGEEQLVITKVVAVAYGNSRL